MKTLRIVCLAALLFFFMGVVCFLGYHWFSTAEGDDLAGLAKNAADFYNYEKLYIEKTAQRGNYLAALCRDKSNNWRMCVFDKDKIFENRWEISGGASNMEIGKIGNWNYGSPQGEAVLIFFGIELQKEISWYTFQNSNIHYICPVKDNGVLDIFIIPDNHDIHGIPEPLDSNRRPLYK